MKKISLFLFFVLVYYFAYAQQTGTNIKGLLSSEGKIFYGNEPNSLMVIDYPENVERVQEYLDAIDIMPLQVAIEARVVEVKLQKEHALGVNWRIFADKGYIPLGAFKLGSSTTLGAVPGALDQALTVPAASVKYPPTSGTAQTPFNIAIFDENINVILQAISSDMDTNILSAPRVTTVNNQPAVIKIIQKQPWAEPQVDTDADGNQTLTWDVKFEEIGIILKVTPTINEDNKISMVLEPQISENVGNFTLTVEGVNYDVPIIDTREAATKVVIGNGQTLIIGGLIKDSVKKGAIKVPLLGDMPLLGYLFKSSRTEREKRELLIFVSPVIISPDKYTYMNKQGQDIQDAKYIKQIKRAEKKLLQKLDKGFDQTPQQEFTSAKLDSLTEKYSDLIEERQKLERDLFDAEEDLRAMEGTLKTKKPKNKK